MPPKTAKTLNKTALNKLTKPVLLNFALSIGLVQGKKSLLKEEIIQFVLSKQDDDVINKFSNLTISSKPSISAESSTEPVNELRQSLHVTFNDKAISESLIPSVLSTIAEEKSILKVDVVKKAKECTTLEQILNLLKIYPEYSKNREIRKIIKNLPDSDEEESTPFSLQEPTQISASKTSTSTPSSVFFLPNTHPVSSTNFTNLSSSSTFITSPSISTQPISIPSSNTTINTQPIPSSNTTINTQPIPIPSSNTTINTQSIPYLSTTINTQSIPSSSTTFTNHTTFPNTQPIHSADFSMLSTTSKSDNVKSKKHKPILTPLSVAKNSDKTTAKIDILKDQIRDSKDISEILSTIKNPTEIHLSILSDVDFDMSRSFGFVAVM